MFVVGPSAEVGVGEVKEFSSGYGFFVVADVQQAGIEVEKESFFVCQEFLTYVSFVVVAFDAADGPIVEDGGTAVFSAKSFDVHAAFAYFLSEVYHDGVGVHCGAYYHGGFASFAAACEEVGGEALFVVVFHEVEHATLESVEVLPFVCYDCG